MNPRRETCRWELVNIMILPEQRIETRRVYSTECGDRFGVSTTPQDCPHCGGRIVREEGE